MDHALMRTEVWSDDLWRLTASEASEVAGFSYLEPRRHIADISRSSTATKPRAWVRRSRQRRRPSRRPRVPNSYMSTCSATASRISISTSHRTGRSAVPSFQTWSRAPNTRPASHRARKCGYLIAIRWWTAMWCRLQL